MLFEEPLNEFLVFTTFYIEIGGKEFYLSRYILTEIAFDR